MIIILLIFNQISLSNVKNDYISEFSSRFSCIFQFLFVTLQYKNNKYKIYPLKYNINYGKEEFFKPTKVVQRFERDASASQGESHCFDEREQPHLCPHGC